MFHGVQRHFWRFFIFTFFFLLFQASLAVVDPDVFYHARMVLEQSHGFVRELPALPLTVFHNGYVDHHYLYHLAVIPFLWLASIIAPSSTIAVFLPFIAIKASAAVFAAMFTCLFWSLLEQWRVPFPRILFLAMLGSPSFLFRLNIPKAPAISLIWLVIGLMFVGWGGGTSRRRKQWWLIAAHSFVYVWLYNGWVVWLLIMGIVAIVATMGAYVWKEWYPHARERVVDLSAVIVGVVAGHIFSPYFPLNIWFAWQHIVRIGFSGIPNGMEVGTEWYGFGIDLFTYIEAMTPVLIVAAVILMALVRAGRVRWSIESVYLGVLSLCFLFLTSQSRRHIEYFVPLCVLFFGVFIRDQNIRQWGLVFTRRQWVIVNVLFTAAVIHNLFFMQRYMNKPSESVLNIIPSAQWLKKNIPEHSMVVLRNWAEFPGYWYYNPTFQYVGGLDPRFTQFPYPEVFSRWQRLVDGSSTSPLADMQFLHGQALVLNNEEDVTVIHKLQKTKGFTKAYTDTDVTIFKAF